MANLIPSDRQQDAQEAVLMRRHFLSDFHQDLHAIYNSGKKTELHQKLLGEVRTIKWINESELEINPSSTFQFKLIYMDKRVTFVNHHELVRNHREIAVWFSNIRRWPLKYQLWRWTASYDTCPMPYDILEHGK